MRSDDALGFSDWRTGTIAKAKKTAEAGIISGPLPCGQVFFIKTASKDADYSYAVAVLTAHSLTLYVDIASKPVWHPVISNARLAGRKRPPITGDRAMDDGKRLRLGPIQRKLMQWVREGGRVFIGAGSVPPDHTGLRGYDLREVEQALNRLVRRGLLESDKPNFYCLPGWKPTPEWLGQ